MEAVAASVDPHRNLALAPDDVVLVAVVTGLYRRQSGLHVLCVDPLDAIFALLS